LTQVPVDPSAGLAVPLTVLTDAEAVILQTGVRTLVGCRCGADEADQRRTAGRYPAVGLRECLGLVSSGSGRVENESVAIGVEMQTK
jgi:hypothetical protein